MPTFGKEVRAARLAKSPPWTQRDLGGKADLTDSQVSHLESGTHNPKMATMTRVAKALGGQVLWDNGEGVAHLMMPKSVSAKSAKSGVTP